ncbi:cytochrome c oxidase assembly protein [Streptomyces hypolithicus]
MTEHPEHHPDDGTPVGVLLPAAALAVTGACYLLLAARARRRNPRAGWSWWRTGFFLAGIALLALALLPPVAPYAHGDFRGHMLQHLLIGMYAPLALVLGAPVTLLLRTLPARRARRFSRALRSRPLRPLAHPVTALALSVGSLGVLYLTPLYDALAAQPGAHWPLHAHFLLSGCLFAWAVAGPDPAPARPGVVPRLVVLGVAIAAHATISQLMYGGFLIDVTAPVAEVQGGAEIMYYGGDIAELLLAVALVATWRPAAAARGPRRPAATAAAPAVPAASSGRPRHG